MGDYITAPAVGTRLAGDMIDGKFWSSSKIGFGADDVATVVSEDTPFPTTDAAVLAALTALVAALAPVAGGATEVTLANLAAKLPASLGAKAASGSLSIVPATGADLATNTSLAAIVTALTATLKVQTPSPIPTTWASGATAQDLRSYEDAEIQVAGLSGGDTITVTRSLDGTNYAPCAWIDQTFTSGTAIVAIGVYGFPGGGYLKFTRTGTASTPVVTIRAHS